MITEDYVRRIFKGLEQGDGASFFEHVDEKVDWIVEGTHPKPVLPSARCASAIKVSVQPSPSLSARSRTVMYLNIRKRLTIGIDYFQPAWNLFDGPWRWEASHLCGIQNGNREETKGRSYDGQRRRLVSPLQIRGTSFGTFDCCRGWQNYPER